MKSRKTAFRLVALVCAVLLTALAVSCAGGSNEPDKPSSTEPKKRVAFTFDDGPTPGITDKFLERIEELNIKATFFVVGNRVSQYGDSLLKQAVAIGCEIGSHTWSHPSSFNSLSESATREQLERSLSVIESATGTKVRLFRPVGGEISDTQLRQIADMGLYTVCWYVDSNDWRANSADDLEAFIDEKVRHIVETAEDGDIILMHDLRESSFEIFSRAAKQLIDRGFDIVTVSEILEISENSVPEAKIYRYGRPIIDPDAAG